jgi:trigger factor
MSAEITKKTDTHVTFIIKLGEAELKHELSHVYDELRPNVKAAGFRPGKAPDNIVEREVGTARVQSEVLDHAASHAYSDAVTKHELTVIASPEMSIKKFVPYTELEFEATVEIMPPVKLAEYQKIKKQPQPLKVDEKQVDEVIEDLRRRVAKRAHVKRAAQMEDEVKIDFDGKKGGQPVEGAQAKNYTLKLGSNQFIPGFEEQLVGLKPDESKTFTVKFPKDYHEKSLADEPVEFTVKLHQVTELQLPELTDAFAGEVGPFKSTEELKADVRDQLTLEAEEAARASYENELLEEIVSKSKLTMPERLISQQLERLKVELSQRLAASGLDMDKYLQLQNKTQEDIEKELRPEAERRVGLAMVLGEVAKEEKITVSAQEVDAEIEELRKRYTDPQMQEELQHSHVREDVYNHLMAGKTINKLVSYAQGK